MTSPWQTKGQLKRMPDVWFCWIYSYVYYMYMLHIVVDINGLMQKRYTVKSLI